MVPRDEEDRGGGEGGGRGIEPRPPSSQRVPFTTASPVNTKKSTSLACICSARAANVAGPSRESPRTANRTGASVPASGAVVKWEGSLTSRRNRCRVNVTWS
jgi:hypothetical protein